MKRILQKKKLIGLGTLPRIIGRLTLLHLSMIQVGTWGKTLTKLLLRIIYLTTLISLILVKRKIKTLRYLIPKPIPKIVTNLTAIRTFLMTILVLLRYIRRFPVKKIPNPVLMFLIKTR